ncbi:MAG: hypothetical protein Q7S13_02170 [Candidatus Omnitrophota bacterium]|nr:hypothetical protein [Candidatus Omnitrophota bacterium]
MTLSKLNFLFCLILTFSFISISTIWAQNSQSPSSGRNVPVIERLFKEREQFLLENQALREENKKFQQGIELLRQQMNAPLTQLSEKEKIIQELSLQKEALLQQLGQLRETKAGLESQLEEFKGTWGQQASLQKQSLDQEKQALLDQISALEEQLNHFDDVRVPLQNRAAVLEERSQAQAQELAAKEEALKSLTKNLEGLRKTQEQHKELSVSYGQLQSRLATIDEEWEGRMKAMRAELAQKNEGMANLEKTLTSVSNELKAVNAQHSELAADREDKEDMSQETPKPLEMKADRKEILTENKALRNKVKLLQEQLANAPEGKKEIVISSAMVPVHPTAAPTKAQEIQARNRELDVMIKEKNSEIRNLLNDKKQVQAELSQTLSRLELVSQRIAELQEKLEREKLAAEGKYIELKQSLGGRILELEQKLQQQGHMSKIGE